MIMSPGRGYIFVHIPKTGGTSLTLALEARAKADDIIISDTPKGQRRRNRVQRLNAPGRLWKHSRLSDIDGMDSLPKPAFVFTLVRNPWDRIASLYHWARAQTFEHPMIEAAKSQSFTEFLKDPGIQSALSNDRASLYVTDRSGQQRCNAFIRLEHLSEDLAPVEAHLGFGLDVPHVNTSQHPPASELYSTETRAIIARLFAEDIDRFSYRFPE
ncbi:MAG: sulfotransferase family 2 domain-containing protein [Pseudomonadota bacterium]